MKYDDDELAEAAILLAYHEPAGDEPRELPAALQKKILTRGKELAAETRRTTTKGAAVALDLVAPGEVSHARRMGGEANAFARRWSGWIAAAACFAVVVYQWQTGRTGARSDRPGEEPGRDGELLVPPPLVRAVDSENKWIADVRPGRDGTTGEIHLVRLPANVAGEHYRAWLSVGAVEQGRPVGSFSCPDECRDRTFSFPLGDLELARVRHVTITRNAVAEPWSAGDRRAVIAEGQCVGP